MKTKTIEKNLDKIDNLLLDLNKYSIHAGVPKNVAEGVVFALHYVEMLISRKTKLPGERLITLRDQLDAAVEVYCPNSLQRELKHTEGDYLRTSNPAECFVKSHIITILIALATLPAYTVICVTLPDVDQRFVIVTTVALALALLIASRTTLVYAFPKIGSRVYQKAFDDSSRFYTLEGTTYWVGKVHGGKRIARDKSWLDGMIAFPCGWQNLTDCLKRIQHAMTRNCKKADIARYATQIESLYDAYNDYVKNYSE